MITTFFVNRLLYLFKWLCNWFNSWRDISKTWKCFSFIFRLFLRHFKYFLDFLSILKYSPKFYWNDELKSLFHFTFVSNQNGNLFIRNNTMPAFFPCNVTFQWINSCLYYTVSLGPKLLFQIFLRFFRRFKYFYILSLF